jgi:hypothetical protein
MTKRQGGRRSNIAKLGLGAVTLTLFAATPLRAQDNQFGGQTRADAAARMIVLGVQQGISSLPPTSGQSLTYEFDPELSTFVASERLGPTSFRSTQTVGPNKWSLRASFSYFFLEDDFGPVKYAVEFQDPITIPDVGTVQPAGISEFGLDAQAEVFLINTGMNYGITDRIELTFNIPISIVKAEANQISTVMQGQENTPADMVQAAGVFQLDPFTNEQQIQDASDEFDRCLAKDPSCQSGFLSQRKDSFNDLGFQFTDDAQLGVGRISVGGKFLFLTTRYLLMAFSTEFFVPSPSEDAYAGSSSSAILPRFIAQLPLHQYFRLHADAGYDYDFSESTLRRFVWNGGASVPIGRWVTFDFGAGGSIFDVPIRWTPPTSEGIGPGGANVKLTALGNTRLGDDFIDFLGGFKVRLTDKLVLSGSATTPLNSEGFRADAVGTVALEAYF